MAVIWTESTKNLCEEIKKCIGDIEKETDIDQQNFNLEKNKSIDD